MTGLFAITTCCYREYHAWSVNFTVKSVKFTLYTLAHPVNLLSRSSSLCSAESAPTKADQNR